MPVLAATITLAACSKYEPDGPELIIEEPEFMVGALENTSTTISFTTNVDRTMSV